MSLQAIYVFTIIYTIVLKGHHQEQIPIVFKGRFSPLSFSLMEKSHMGTSCDLHAGLHGKHFSTDSVLLHFSSCCYLHTSVKSSLHLALDKGNARVISTNPNCRIQDSRPEHITNFIAVMSI